MTPPTRTGPAPRPRPALPDPRNAQIQVYIDGELLPRAAARVSVFDSSVQGGDAVWEGLRVYDGGVFRLAAHLDRLERSARALGFESVPAHKQIVDAIARTLRANGMRDGVHIRLTLTRGEKVTSGMSPSFNRSGPCLIVLAEFKPPVYDARGIRLVTSSVRRNPPQCLDSRIHHANLLNNILAKLESDAAGADDAIMLDVEGYVAETNATNLFLVRDGALATPTADHCLPGITRAVVLQLARDKGLVAVERRVSLAEFRTAGEVFTSGTMGELTPVIAIDGQPVGSGEPGPVTAVLRDGFAERITAESEPLPI